MIPRARLTEQQKEVVERLSKHLVSWLSRSRLEPMKKVSATFKDYKESILAYFVNRHTNAIAEGLNSLIQSAKRRARGFRSFESYACRIFLVVGKLKFSYPTLFSYYLSVIFSQ